MYARGFTVDCCSFIKINLDKMRELKTRLLISFENNAFSFIRSVGSLCVLVYLLFAGPEKNTNVNSKALAGK